MERERARRVEDGDDDDGEQRRVRAVAAGRLAVAADPVPGERQQQRREAERLERRRVDERGPPKNPADGTEERAAQERDARRASRAARSGVPPSELDRARIETWSSAATNTTSATLPASSAAFIGSSRLRHEDDHAVERVEVDERLDLDPLVEVGVGLADEADRRRSGSRADRATAARPSATRGDDRVAALDDARPSSRGRARERRCRRARCWTSPVAPVSRIRAPRRRSPRR